MITKFSKSFGFALTGIKIAWREELNFKIEIFCAVLVLITGYILHITYLEFAILALTIGFVLAIEGLNTALEELCDKFQPTHDPHIAKIKDLAAAAVLLSSIGALAVALFIFGPHIVKLDYALETWLEGVRTPNFTHIFRWITILGNGYFVLISAAIIGLAILLKKKIRVFAGFMVILFGTAVSVQVIKLLVARERPSLLHLLPSESLYSFPSLHAAAALALYSFLVWLACQYLPKGPARKLMAFLAIIIILAVGASRVYLGVHFLSDVLAGYTVALMWLAVGIRIASKK
ncbi:MAG TPA: diacylglycerol kinase [Candidatus Paceibacterota bacterium]